MSARVSLVLCCLAALCLGQAIVLVLTHLLADQVHGFAMGLMDEVFNALNGTGIKR